MTDAIEVTRIVAAACRADDRITAALTYGSVPQGRADAYSDAEFWIFMAAPVDVEQWLRQVLPDVLYVAETEFGGHVAILAGLLRVEAHVVPADDVEVVRSWPALSGPVDEMLIVDHDGRLTEILRSLPSRVPVEAAAAVCGRFANWWLLGWNVLQRGECERAYDALGHVRRQLLWMLRLRHDADQTWLTPSRRAEVELPSAAVRELAGTAPAGVGAEALRVAYLESWRVGRRLWQELCADDAPTALWAEIDRTTA